MNDRIKFARYKLFTTMIETPGESQENEEFISKRVLSIQSHVVHGYVGNRAATFPLQLNGWDVDALNSVHFSNHTGYGEFKGTRTTGTELNDIYQGLKKFEYDAMLTGYVPSAEGVQAMGQIGIDIKKRFPEAIWLLDPVMGDDGHLYVASSVIPAYEEILKSGAVNIITPNQFETEILTGIKFEDPDVFTSSQRVVAKLFEKYKVPNVVVSSIKNGGNLVTIGATSDGLGGFKTFAFSYPAYDIHFTGTGDLFSALLLEKFYHYTVVLPPPENYKILPLEVAVHDTLSIMNRVLGRTRDYALSKGFTGKCGTLEEMKHLELRIIQSQDIITGPPVPLPLEPEHLETK